jgi:hypothetical protein
MIDFMCYVSTSGDDEVRLWYEAQSPGVQGAIVAVVETLRHRPRDRWRRKPYADLRGKLCSGLGELRIEEPPKTHHRILGFFGEASASFVLLCAFRKDLDPEYRLACPEAQKRKSRVEHDQTRARECHVQSHGSRREQPG